MTAIHNSLTTQHNALRAIPNALTTKHNALTTKHNGLKLCLNALTTNYNTFTMHWQRVATHFQGTTRLRWFSLCRVFANRVTYFIIGHSHPLICTYIMYISYIKHGIIIRDYIWVLLYCNHKLVTWESEHGTLYTALFHSAIQLPMLPHFYL